MASAKVGDRIRFRGKFARGFNLRGVVETIAVPGFVQEHNLDGKWGVRLENGNFRWGSESQLRVER